MTDPKRMVVDFQHKNKESYLSRLRENVGGVLERVKGMAFFIQTKTKLQLEHEQVLVFSQAEVGQRYGLYRDKGLMFLEKSKSKKKYLFVIRIQSMQEILMDFFFEKHQLKVGSVQAMEYQLQQMDKFIRVLQRVANLYDRNQELSLIKKSLVFGHIREVIQRIKKDKIEMHDFGDSTVLFYTMFNDSVIKQVLDFFDFLAPLLAESTFIPLFAEAIINEHFEKVL